MIKPIWRPQLNALAKDSSTLIRCSLWLCNILLAVPLSCALTVGCRFDDPRAEIPLNAHPTSVTSQLTRMPTDRPGNGVVAPSTVDIVSKMKSLTHMRELIFGNCLQNGVYESFWSCSYGFSCVIGKMCVLVRSWIGGLWLAFLPLISLSWYLFFDQ